MSKMTDQDRITATAAVFGVGMTIGGAMAYLSRNWKAARADQYLVKTGWLINGRRGMSVSRRFLRLPGQKVEAVTMTPRSLHFDLNCLSKQYLPFNMPVTYTVAPFDPTSDETFQGHEHDGDKIWTSDELFRNYAERMAHLSLEEFYTTVLGVVHGETRVQAAQMPIDAINDDRDAFRHTVTNNIQKSLLSLGVRVTNANIAELQEKERDGQMGYLKARERKKLSEAVEQSHIDVMDREADKRKQVAELEATARTFELEQLQVVARAQAALAEVEAETRRRTEVAAVEADAAREQRRQVLQKEIEQATALQAVEAQRAIELTRTKVAAECRICEAEGHRDANIQEAQGCAQAIRLVAEAEQMRGEALAKAKFAELKAVADGELALLEARAQGAKLLVQACDNDPAVLANMLSVQNGIPQAAFKEAAKAVQGLNPQIFSMTGDNAGTELARIVGGFAPVLEAFNKVWNKDVPRAVEGNHGAVSKAVQDGKRAISYGGDH